MCNVLFICGTRLFCICFYENIKLFIFHGMNWNALFSCSTVFSLKMALLLGRVCKNQVQSLLHKTYLGRVIFIAIKGDFSKQHIIILCCEWLFFFCMSIFDSFVAFPFISPCLLYSEYPFSFTWISFSWIVIPKTPNKLVSCFSAFLVNTVRDVVFTLRVWPFHGFNWKLELFAKAP